MAAAPAHSCKRIWLCTVASDNFIIIVYQNASGYTRKNDLKSANFNFYRGILFDCSQKGICLLQLT